MTCTYSSRSGAKVLNHDIYLTNKDIRGIIINMDTIWFTLLAVLSYAAVGIAVYDGFAYRIDRMWFAAILGIFWPVVFAALFVGGGIVHVAGIFKKPEEG
jgi:hypothetical protein